MLRSYAGWRGSLTRQRQRRAQQIARSLQWSAEIAALAGETERLTIEIEALYEDDPLALLSEIALSQYRRMLHGALTLLDGPVKGRSAKLRKLKASPQLADRLQYALYYAILDARRKKEKRDDPEASPL